MIFYGWIDAFNGGCTRIMVEIGKVALLTT